MSAFLISTAVVQNICLVSDESQLLDDLLRNMQPVQVALQQIRDMVGPQMRPAHEFSIDLVALAEKLADLLVV